MNIHLVTGATGFVGRYLVTRLLCDGERVWVVVRGLNSQSGQARAGEIFSDFLAKWPKTFQVIDGDIMAHNLGLSGAVLRELANQQVVVWHLAANLSFAADHRAQAQKTNYAGTVNVVQLANKIGGRYMHMSTAYVGGDAPSLSERELSKGQRFRNHYEKSKFAAEQYVRSHCKIPYLIFRPSIIIGDAYRGKAEGCTFGYYRYVFMFHFLKKKIVKVLHNKGLRAQILRLLGTSYDMKRDILLVPWLVIPYPRNGQVDFVPVDYVVEAMIVLHQKKLSGQAVHLTHQSPPAYHFLLRAVLDDMGFSGMKLVSVPVWGFYAIVYGAYLFALPLRTYIRSIMWYLPYFTKPCVFERTTIKQYWGDPPVISRAFMARINQYAKKHILNQIQI